MRKEDKMENAKYDYLFRKQQEQITKLKKAISLLLECADIGDFEKINEIKDLIALNKEEGKDG